MAENIFKNMCKVMLSNLVNLTSQSTNSMDQGYLKWKHCIMVPSKEEDARSNVPSNKANVFIDLV